MGSFDGIPFSLLFFNGLPRLLHFLSSVHRRLKAPMEIMGSRHKDWSRELESNHKSRGNQAVCFVWLLASISFWSYRSPLRYLIVSTSSAPNATVAVLHSEEEQTQMSQLMGTIEPRLKMQGSRVVSMQSLVASPKHHTISSPP